MISDADAQRLRQMGDILKDREPNVVAVLASVSGEKITFPRLQLSPDGHNYQQSSFWVQDGSFLRLKNVEIGYTFPKEMLQQVRISNLRVYVSGNNLFTWKNNKYPMDPDAREQWGRVYPPMRVYNIGVNFQF